MKITGTFKTEKEHTIRVTFYNKRSTLPSININTSDDIFFGDEPVIITNEADDTFEHILRTQAKVTLVARNWLGDYLFADNAKSIVVNIWKDDVCIFAGYCSPNSFNQNFSHELEPIEINCVDTLTTLQNRLLTDEYTYEELKAQSTIRPFSWFFDKINLEDPAGVIPNLPDYPVEEMHIWVETSWTRMIDENNDILYYAIESECVVLDEDTAVSTGETRLGSYKTPTYIQSEDTCIVDGVSYYKEYAHITVNGEDINTGDWRVGSNAGGMPVVVRTENRIDGWTNGVLPQPFDFYEHYTTYNIYDNGMEIAASDGIGEQIPETPQTTTNGSYYEFRQGSADDVDVDEDTGYIYYKDYAWVCVNNECTNSGQWQRGNEKAHPTGTHTAITGWQYDDPAVPFEYYEIISHYIDYSDGTSEFDHTTMGHQIPLTPNTTTNGSYYEFRQGDADDLDIDQTTGFEYYKEYAWVVVNNVAEQTTNWRRGDRVNQFNYAPIYGKMINGATNPPTFIFGSYNGGSTTKTADLFDSTTGEFGFTTENIPTYNRPYYKPSGELLNIEELYYNLPSTNMDFNNWFTDCVNLRVLDIECFYVSYLLNAFKGCTSLTNLKIRNNSTWDTMAESAFEGCTNLPGTIDLSYVNIDRCSNMFKNCTSLDTVKLSGHTVLYNELYNYTSSGLFDGSSVKTVYYYLDNIGSNNLIDANLLYDSMMSSSEKPKLIIPITTIHHNSSVIDVEYELEYDTINSFYQSNFDIFVSGNNTPMCTIKVIDNTYNETTVILTPTIIYNSGDYNWGYFKIPNEYRTNIKEIRVEDCTYYTFISPIEGYIWNSIENRATELNVVNGVSLDLSLMNAISDNYSTMLRSDLMYLYLGHLRINSGGHTDMFANCQNLTDITISNYDTFVELTSGVGNDYVPTTATIHMYDFNNGWTATGDFIYNSSTQQWELQS